MLSKILLIFSFVITLLVGSFFVSAQPALAVKIIAGTPVPVWDDHKGGASRPEAEEACSGYGTTYIEKIETESSRQRCIKILLNENDRAFIYPHEVARCQGGLGVLTERQCLEKELTEAATEQKEKDDTTFAWILGGLLDMLLPIFTAVINFLGNLASSFAWLGSTILHASVSLFVLGMGDILKRTEVPIHMLWGIVRDLMNLAIIGGFIAIAFSTILQIVNYAASKLLSKLIIAALLVNFSYFFTGAMIDASNFVSTKIYESMIVQEWCGDAKGDCSIGRIFMGIFNIGTTDDPAVTRTPEGLFFTSVLRLVLFIVVGFTFFRAAFFLIGRFISLVLLLISSPLGIAGMSMPFVGTYATKWWKALSGQLLSVPVLFFLIGVSITILGYLKTATEKVAPIAEIFAGDYVGAASATLTLFFSILAIMLLWRSVSIAESIAETSEGWFKDVYKGVNKMKGFIGRNSVGLGSGALYDSRWYKYLEARPFVGSTARMFGRGLKKGTETKFGGDPSYRDAQAKQAKARTARFDRLGETQTLRQKVGEENKAFAERVDAEKKRAEERQAAFYARKGTLPFTSTRLWSTDEFKKYANEMESKVGADQAARLKKAAEKAAEEKPADRKSREDKEDTDKNAELDALNRIANLNQKNVDEIKKLRLDSREIEQNLRDKDLSVDKRATGEAVLTMNNEKIKRLENVELYTATEYFAAENKKIEILRNQLASETDNTKQIAITRDIKAIIMEVEQGKMPFRAYTGQQYNIGSQAQVPQIAPPAAAAPPPPPPAPAPAPPAPTKTP